MTDGDLLRHVLQLLSSSLSIKAKVNNDEVKQA